ncbi:hypothetical protein MNV49_001776 [Pseudohyphozyma bogoriensis]|nr:hypothetical protein MNV49_001776 [Pseudohyphozyma bogoriensis]
MNRAPKLDPDVFSIAGLQASAEKKLTKMHKEYFGEGAMDLITLRDNSAAYDRYKIRPRILKDVSNLDPSTTVFGSKVTFPFGFSPAAMHKIAHPRGEEATSSAAAKFGTAMALSTYSTVSLETVAAQGRGNPYVMQLSLVRDDSFNLQIIKRAEAAGYRALFVTVDCPVLGRRLNEIRNDFTLPEGTSFPNFPPDLENPDLDTTEDRMQYNNTHTFSSLMKWLRSVTTLEIWLKGVYTAEDVEEAVTHGVNGIIVSNHGGRQLDGVTATLDALPECVAAAAGRIPVHIDGGIRRGTDIFKALALGASHCWAGRVPLWGLAHNGEEGVHLALQLLYDEFTTAMSLAGCKTVADIKSSHLAKFGSNGNLYKL